jgi:aminopeptidase N
MGINLDDAYPKREKRYPAFSKRDSLIGSPSFEKMCYNVLHYDLDLKINPESKYINGAMRISIEMDSSSSTIMVDLFSNLKINRIHFLDRPLEYTRLHDAVFINLPRRFEPSEELEIVIEYEGSPIIAKRPPWVGGFTWKKDQNEKPWAGVSNEALGASCWVPVKDLNRDEPDLGATLKFTVPKGLFCASNGTLTHSYEREPDWETFVWEVANPINPYNITFYLGDFVKVALPYRDTLEIQCYVLKGNEEKALDHFKQSIPILNSFESSFGAYPGWKDGFKFIESPYEGMEHQSAIAYGNGYKNNYLGFDYIILHEAAHEWWGNSVTAIDFADVWLQEGFATYSEALFVEESRGHQAYLNYLMFYRLLIKNNHPVVGPDSVFYFSYKNSDVYMKGAWILHTLRTQLKNDTLFKEMLKSFCIENQWNIVSSQDFIDHVNQKSGKNWDAFFAQYLNDRRPPKLVLEYIKSGSSIEVQHYLKDCIEPLTLSIRLDTEDGPIWIEASTDVKIEKLGSFSFAFNQGYYKLEMKEVKKFTVRDN